MGLLKEMLKKMYSKKLLRKGASESKFTQKKIKNKNKNKKEKVFLQDEVAKTSFSILGDMEMHKWLWKCITETNVMENIKWEEI